MTDRKLMVTLGGLPQRVRIWTKDENKPVLLFLHGGPGVCNRHAVMKHSADLLDTFTLAAWDQRGSGGSYWGAKKETLTIERLTDDAAELVEWLCRTFHKDKIFIIGGSWGSELGVWLASRYPQRIAAFVGFGQLVNAEKNEDLSYAFALEEAQKAGDEKAVNRLKSVGPPVMGMYKGGYAGMMTQRRVMMKYGGYSQSKKKRSYFSSFVVPVLFSGEYSLKDLIGLIKGSRFVLETMWEEIGRTDFEASCTKFEVPMFIFDGVLDQNTPSALVEHWFNMIEAPKKELVWFTESGHNPMSDEPEKFKALLCQRLTEIAKEGKNV